MQNISRFSLTVYYSFIIISLVHVNMNTYETIRMENAVASMALLLIFINWVQVLYFGVSIYRISNRFPLGVLDELQKRKIFLLSLMVMRTFQLTRIAIPTTKMAANTPTTIATTFGSGGHTGSLLTSTLILLPAS